MQNEKQKFEDIKPPSPFGLIKETLGILEFSRLLRHFPDLARQPKGIKEPVLVIPGFGTSDRITGILRFYLKYLNYSPAGWGLGRNNGKVPELLSMLSKKFFPDSISIFGPCHLIGWSLGGYMARELAREYPTQIRQVITLGSPVVGGPKYTISAGFYRKKGYDLDEIERTVANRDAIPLTVPVTAIYSKNDRVVAWQACIDTVNSNIEHIEVRTTHGGLGFDPDVYRIIAKQLAAFKK